jgi:hypothetical protein
LILARGGGLGGDAQPQRGTWLVPLAVVSAACSACLAFPALSGGDALPVLAGLACGLITGLAVSPLIRMVVEPLVSGDSGSGARTRTVTIAFSIAVGCLTVFALVVGFNHLFPKPAE